jgi:pyruvate dehydrogenase E2 component (dihydrolipoamide acetyltransferase)
MAVFIEMPKFGLSMEEGTITAWLKSEGEAVDKGEEIAEVTTEKITNTVEAPASGILVKILLQQNETAVCGANIGIIARRNEDISALLADTEPLLEPEQQPRLGSVSEQKGSFTAQGMITPKAQKFC